LAAASHPFHARDARPGDELTLRRRRAENGERDAAAFAPVNEEGAPSAEAPPKMARRPAPPDQK
jgi:hypothetical protein